MDNTLSDRQIDVLSGIGPQRARLFGRLGIKKVGDALYYLPYRYEDRSKISDICDLECGSAATVEGRVVSSLIRSSGRRRFSIVEVVIDDGTGRVKAKWYNQPFMQKNFPAGKEIVLSGNIPDVPFSGGMLEIENPEYEDATPDGAPGIHTGRIVPVYRLTDGISGKRFRRIMSEVIRSCSEELSDFVPAEITARYGLPSLRESILQVHFPGPGTPLDLLNKGTSEYHKRLSFNELFLFELGMTLVKKKRCKRKRSPLHCRGNLMEDVLERLPFDLTAAQKRTVDEILGDMKRPYPMHRLLQGDVGSGKTVVALLAMLHAVECGCQTALMAPTEILAEQHFFNIRRMIEPLGIKCGLLTSGGCKELRDAVASGDTPVVIGTHALIQEGVVFRDLGLAVIDEQHKFGVMQRSLLRKKGMNPHLLVMTATPIPRSLALTLYGDLDSSVVDETPPGRKPVVTKVIDAVEKKLVYEILSKEVGEGRQAYVVYPAIEDSEKSDLKSAQQGKEALERIFPGFRIGLVHGKMKTMERENVMKSFRDGQIDILVSTTVIEVGVDTPGATVMVVVHAERFGLAQLHQLRGRVGRGSDQSYCLLIAYGPLEGGAGRRLAIMEESSDGFRLAEEDLSIRGPGDFLGVRQAGMPDLNLADILRDADILEIAKKEAVSLLEESPDLREYPFLKRSLEKFWNGRDDFYKAG
jgi:ATP-dependent DNA helicase RecG